MSRDPSELDLAALMLDGVHFADAWCVVALAIGADGTKVPVGLWLGDTENKTVVTAPLADLVARGLTTDGGLLVVIDGAKPSPPRCARCSATPRSSSGARCTSAATSATTSRRTNKRGSMAGSPPRTTTTIPRRVNVPVETWPGSSRRVGPMRWRACARRPRGHVHRPAARCRRPARRDPHEHELHREPDLDRARHDQEREAVARRQDDQTLVCRRDAQRGTQLPPAQGLPADADVRRCARPSPRSCSTGMRCCTSRMSGRTDAPPPSGRDSKLDAQTTSVPES
jgi:putative transposase